MVRKNICFCQNNILDQPDEVGIQNSELINLVKNVQIKTTPIRPKRKKDFCLVTHAFTVSTFLSLYRTNAILNVATFVLFRILLLGWMTRWLTIHRDDVPIIFFTVGSLGLATIVGMNIVLFYRILVGDYLGSKKKNKATDAVTEDYMEESDNEATPSVEFKDCTSLPSSAHRRRQPHHLTKDVNRIVEGALRLVE